MLSTVVQHHIHVSVEDPELVAYAQSWQHLIDDRFTSAKPGRYLKKFFGSLFNEAEIKHLVEQYAVMSAGQGKLLFVESDDPDGWEAVYESGHGFTSCMTYKRANSSERYIDERLHGKYHPVRAYAYPGNGIRLAYLANHKHVAPEGLEVYARSIVREDPKGFIRVYGDGRLNAALEAAGYGTPVNLDGVKLAKLNVPDSEGIICPYLDSGADGSQHAEIFSDHLRVGAGRGPDASGILHGTRNDDDEETMYCADCDEQTGEDDLYFIHTSETTVCGSCRDNNYTYGVITRRGHEGYGGNDDMVYCSSDERYYLANVLEAFEIVEARDGDYHFQADCAFISDRDEYFHLDDVHDLNETFYEGEDDQQWPKDRCRELHDGTYAKRDDAVELDGAWYHTEELWWVSIPGLEGRRDVYPDAEMLLEDIDSWSVLSTLVFEPNRPPAVQLVHVNDQSRTGFRLEAFMSLRAYLLAYKDNPGGLPAFVNITEGEHTPGEQGEIFAAVLEDLEPQQLARAA